MEEGRDTQDRLLWKGGEIHRTDVEEGRDTQDRLMWKGGEIHRTD